MKPFNSRPQYAVVALLSVATTISLSPLVRADAQYTSVLSVGMDGDLSPVGKTTTWIKAGLERLDSTQELGAFKMSETTIFNVAQKERLTVDYDRKVYVAELLSDAPAPADDTPTDKPDKEKTGVGQFITTLGANLIGMETLLDRPVRHYETSVATESSGCCGVSKTSIKEQVWMADVTLPVFDAGTKTPDPQSTLAATGGKCRIEYQRKGDVAGYDAAQKGLALKSITYDEKGQPLASNEITSLSLAPLEDDQFTVPADFKKISRADYDAARAQAMSKAATLMGQMGAKDDQ